MLPPLRVNPARPVNYLASGHPPGRLGYPYKRDRRSNCHLCTFLSQKPPTPGAVTCSRQLRLLTFWSTCSSTAESAHSGGEKKLELLLAFLAREPKMTSASSQRQEMNCSLPSNLQFSCFASHASLQILARAWEGFLWHSGLLSLSPEVIHPAPCHRRLVCHVSAC